MAAKSASRRSDLLADYLPERDLATELKVNVRTLARWRQLQIGPPFVMRGREVEYLVPGVRDWLASGGTGRGQRRRKG